jgi:hypothetical protein
LILHARRCGLACIGLDAEDRTADLFSLVETTLFIRRRGALDRFRHGERYLGHVKFLRACTSPEGEFSMARVTLPSAVKAQLKL